MCRPQSCVRWRPVWPGIGLAQERISLPITVAQMVAPYPMQGISTIGVRLPTAHASTIGHPILTKLAFQYHLNPIFWPEFEVNYTAQFCLCICY